jgi:alpha-1,2-mannosyltransferase
VNYRFGTRRKLLTLFGISTFICSSVSGYWLISLLFTKYLYHKDFTQPYLMGHALRAGANLYAPIPELAARFDPSLNRWLKVSAYPPIVAVIGLPFSYLPYFWAVIAWMVFELVCLSLAIVLIVRHFGSRAAATPVLILVLAFISWTPLYIELNLGQLMIPILLLLTLSWLALKAGNDFRAGLLLGIVMAIKLYAWPIALFLLIKGRWRAPLAALIVFIAANGLAIGLVGKATLLDYYFRVGGTVFAEYKLDPFNFSTWSVGYRALGITGGVLMSLAVLSYSLVLALRAKDFDAGFMVMLTAATILQPISWIHYMVTLLPAFCWIGNRREFRTSDLLLGMLLIMLILPGFYPGAHSYAPLATWPPFFFIIGLMWLIVPKTIKERTVILLARAT